MGKTNKNTPSDPDPNPEPRNQGDSEERTGLWKPGDGGFDSHLPDKGRSLDELYEIIKHNAIYYGGEII